MPGIELRPRSGTEIVDAAFQLYRKHFTALITISAVVLAPLIALNLVLTGGDPTIQAARPLASLALISFAWIFSTLSEAAIVLAVSDSVLQGVVDAAAALRRMLRRIATVLVAAWLKWFVVLFSILLALSVAGFAAALMMGGASATVGVQVTTTVVIAFVLAFAAIAVGGGVGMFYYACYFAVSPAVMIEGQGAAASLTRSRQLSKGMRRKVLGTLGTPMFVLLILQFVIAAIAQSLPGPAAIGFVIQQAATVLLSPIVAVIATLLYYDARIRNEGFDIEIMARELTEPSATAAPSA